MQSLVIDLVPQFSRYSPIQYGWHLPNVKTNTTSFSNHSLLSFQRRWYRWRNSLGCRKPAWFRTRNMWTARKTTRQEEETYSLHKVPDLRARKTIQISTISVCSRARTSCSYDQPYSNPSQNMVPKSSIQVSTKVQAEFFWKRGCWLRTSRAFTWVFQTRSCGLYRLQQTM